MKKRNKRKGTFGIILTIGLILIIPLFFAIKTAAEKQEAKNTPMPLTPTVMATLEANSATAAKQPPRCTFPLPQTTTTEFVPKEYTFSEPRVVLTADAHIEIVEWLPDNQRVLITQDFRDNNQQNIVLFNPQTGAMQIYATRDRIGKSPRWLPELNAVIYPVMNVLKEDKINHRYEYTRQVLISRGNPNNTQLIADNLTDFSIAVKPGNSQIVYLSDKHLFKRNASLEALQSVAFDPIQWDYRQTSGVLSASYNMAWRPGTSQIFLYNLGDLGGYTFLIDTDNGQICEIDLGSVGNENGWADIARWSPDGKYLAIIRTWGSRPVDTSDLVILDTMTGKLSVMKIIPSDMEGLHFVNDIAWAPDNRHLAVIGQILYQNQDILGSLYLVDFLSEQSILVLSDQNLGSGLGDANLIWSHDGSQLLVKCPTSQEDRLCLFSVQESVQP
jgi:hypothetical protein